MRKKLYKLHSYFALAALIPLIIVSITGSILVFKTEIDQWLMPDSAALPYKSEGASVQRQDLNVLKDHLEASFPAYILGSWELFTDGQEADRVYLIERGTDEWYKVFFDPYAGEILSEPVSTTSYLTDWLLSLHYTFLLNGIGGEHAQWGTVLGLIAAAILTFLGISGLIIHRKFWLQMFTLRTDRNARVLYGDIHRLVGAWSSPVMLILGITGIYFNALALYHEWFEHPSEDHYEPVAPLYAENLDFQAMLDDSRQSLEDFTPTYLLFPYEPEVHITFFGYQPSANPFASNYASTVTYDKGNGELMLAYDGRKAGVIRQLFDSFRELHFGSFAGLGSKLLWCLFGLAPAVLGLTGLYVWIARHSKKSRRRSASVASTTATSGS